MTNTMIEKLACTCGFTVTAGADCMFCGADAEMVLEGVRSGTPVVALPVGITPLR